MNTIIRIGEFVINLYIYIYIRYKLREMYRERERERERVCRGARVCALVSGCKYVSPDAGRQIRKQSRFYYLPAVVQEPQQPQWGINIQKEFICVSGPRLCIYRARILYYRHIVSVL